MSLNRPKLTSAALVATALALAVSGCGGGNSTSANTSSGGYTKTATKSSSNTVTTKPSSVGTILAGAGGRTLYLFEADSSGKSACSGACAGAWPPLTVTGKPTASGAAEQSKLGTIKRGDGSTQVTYAGHPLYYYVKDTTADDVNGNAVEAFGAEWYALTPSGANAERSAPKRYGGGY